MLGMTQIDPYTARIKIAGVHHAVQADSLLIQQVHCALSEAGTAWSG